MIWSGFGLPVSSSGTLAERLLWPWATERSSRSQSGILSFVRMLWYERTSQGQLCHFLLGSNALYGLQLLHQLKQPRQSEWPWLQTGHAAGFAPFASSCILNSLNGLQFLDSGCNLWSGIFWGGQLILQLRNEGSSPDIRSSPLISSQSFFRDFYFSGNSFRSLVTLHWWW